MRLVVNTQMSFDCSWHHSTLLAAECARAEGTVGGVEL